MSEPGRDEYASVLETIAGGSAPGGSLSGRLRCTGGEVECPIEPAGAGVFFGMAGQVTWTSEEVDRLDPAWFE